MTEILAALLLVLGAAIALIAAIGVARLPDAFLRMHAATKAGVVGAGLAFGGGDAWLRVGLIVLFLLVTVPISSHALGRAAYIGGAPLWPGSADALAGVLPRRSIDEDDGLPVAAKQAAAIPPPAIETTPTPPGGLARPASTGGTSGTPA